MSKRKKGCLIAVGVFVVAIAGVLLFYGPTALNFWHVYGPDLVREPERQKYAASREQNLKAIYQGLMLYHESEGQFPTSEGWMDAIENRIKSNVLAKGEAEKKLVRPDLASEQGAFGYAMNDAASGKYMDDIPDKGKTPLIYESKQKTRNAHGDPAEDSDGLAITVDGTLIKESH